MSIADTIQNKTITVEEALALVKSDSHIVAGMAASEGQLFFSQLHTIADRVKAVTVNNCLSLADHAFVDEQYAGSFNVDTWFYSARLRKAHANGNISFIPNHLHLVAVKRLAAIKPHIFVGIASRPDKHGYMSLSFGNVYEKRMIEAADIVILEISDKFPRTFGDLEVHVDQVNHLIDVDYTPPYLPEVPSNDRDRVIGQLIAEHINDGDCLQLGIGGIPSAVADFLTDKKDLGIHTEMLSTSLMKLVKCGAVTNARKTLHPGKTVTTFALGTQELYDWIDDNPSVQVLDGRYVNDPGVIAQNDNQVSINTTIEIDLVGQCCSESIGHVQFSGTGGQADTAIGAVKAKNGRSFIALYSTANVLNKATGERETVSKIVPMLKPGAIVSLSRNDVDYVVTEYGLVNLRGTTLRERVKLLISIAHPDFREELTTNAKAMGYIS